jgi:curved DNA-binding protein CbpA
MNPYLILGVPAEADDPTIRQAYIAGIKQAPPETHPERFKALTTAYEQIKDESSRHRYELFSTDSPGDSPLQVYLQHLRFCQLKPLPLESMKEFLRACLKT